MSLPKPSPSSPYVQVVRLELLAGVTRSESHSNHEYSLIVAALEHCHGNISETAERLEVHRNSLGRKVREFKLGGFAKQLRQIPRRQLRLVFDPVMKPKTSGPARSGGKACASPPEESVRWRA